MLSIVRSVFHPTDLSKNGEAAYAHAVALAVAGKTDLTILNVGKGDPKHKRWKGFPGVRELLERWGRLEQGSRRSDVSEKLGMRVQKIAVSSSNPVAAMLQFLEDEPADLIVLGTGGREGLPRWLKPSKSEPVARRSKTAALFVPSGRSGFVSAKTGELSMRHILVPVDRIPVPDPALDAASDAAALLGAGPVEITLTHVASDGDAPDFALPPDSERCVWKTSHRKGDAVKQILAEASAIGADLIVMTTQGHEGFLDALRGSTTEQVVRRASCPVLAVPGLTVE